MGVMADTAKARLLSMLAEGSCRAMPAVCRACGREFDLSGSAPGAVVSCPGCGATMDAPTPAPGPGPVGRYRIIELIGRGAMGTVFRAEDTLLNREVALKLVAHAAVSSPGSLERFRREAQAMAQVDHPNVVKLFDVGEINGDPYLVMELIRGDHLATAFAQRPMRARVQLIEKIARAVQAAHDRGIVHRDLKPQNVLIDGTGEPRVMDFGLARLDDGAPLTRDGTAVGTPPYMAPEQIRGGAIDARTDVFGLGAMLYEALTAQVPHPGGNVAETFHAILTQEPVPPRRLNARLPLDLETVCLRALEKEPDKRYATAKALAEDLRRWLDGEAVDARRPGALARVFRFLHRRRAVVVPVGVAVAGALGITTTLQLTMPRVRQVESNWAAAQEQAKAAETRAAAMARVQAALDRAVECVYDGAASGDDLRARASEAERLARDLTNAMPTFMEAHVAHGRALRLLGDDVGAKADFDRALRRNPNLGEAYFERGRLLLDRAMRARAPEMEQATRDFESAVRCGTPSRREMELARIWAIALKGNRDGAIAEASRVIELGGRVEDFLALRGAARTDARAAIADFDEALRRRPNDAWLRFARGTRRMEAGDHAGAVEDLSRAIALRPNFAEAYQRRGACHRALRDLDRTVADLERAVALGADARAELDEARRAKDGRP